jgi:metallo-beta-lactamase family protein
LFSTVEYGERLELGGGLRAVFQEAGHILGSASVRIEFGENGRKASVLCSGDVGRWDRPIIRDPAPAAESDYILMESTYGGSRHEEVGGIEAALAEAVMSTCRSGGNLLIPSFALERAQEVLYYLNRLLAADRIPHVLVFLDSPMAVSVTEVFLRHPGLFDEDMRRLLLAGNSPFQFPGLTMVRGAGESKAINRIRGTAVIIAGSGMCTGGRIKHHLANNVGRKESTVLFVGYQAEGTLGREILSGAARLRILGQTYRRRARVLKINGFSAHADQQELLRWLKGVRQPPRRLFLTHGEPPAVEALAAAVREYLGWPAYSPSYGETVSLD